uniref:Uncharacterized protein n=1 Tax=Quercus lobata TaxID=97700 RepID=A0A7N2KRW4_QUELO
MMALSEKKGQKQQNRKLAWYGESSNVNYIVQQVLTSNLMESFKEIGRDITSFLNASITEKMERVREILRKFGMLNDTFPYQPELSRHAVVVAPLSCVFFLFFDIMHTLKDDNSIVWWSVHVGLLGFFYFFLQPLIGEPSYSNLSKWYVSWLFVALVYHLPSSQSVAILIRMNLSLFLTIFIFSIVCLLVFHYIFILVEYNFSYQNRKWPDTWTILQFSAYSLLCISESL